MDFTRAQLTRYARHIVLPEIGGIGQEKLLNARVLVVGAGGLGSPLLLYLAAAGIGTLGIVDDDAVDLSNLQRQVIHRTDAIGTPKVESARLAIARLNPDVAVIAYRERIEAANALKIVGDYDLVADGSDNFATRYLVNDSCFLARRTLVAAAVLRFEAQLSTFKAHLEGDYPCYRCLFRDAPAPGLVPSCAEGGVLGALAGAVGAIQAIEVIKEILGIGEGLAGRLLLYDGLGTAFHTIRVRRDPDCPLCGERPSIRDLSRHAA